MAKQNDQIGPYTLVSKLGRGAFGVVWLAEKRTAITTTKVAIKIPNDEDVDLEAVKQEASLWVHASGHPNVLPIIDADIHDEHVIIVSEYAPDGSLTKWLEKHGGKAPSIESAVVMTLGILAGLEHLHERGIIHRDLKPDNILLQRETPRLADFGIARILKNTSKSTVATGTPAYMPPEAFDGKRSERTDIWSAGAIFYQLLSGKLPFPQEEFTSLVGAILTKEPEPLPSSIPEQLREVVESALKKNPDERWRSAGEMRQALRNIARWRELSQNSIETKVLPPSSNVKTEVLPKQAGREIPPTVFYPGHKRTNPNPTVAAATIASPAVQSPFPESQASTQTEAKAKSNSWKWIVAAVVVLLMTGAGILFLVNSQKASTSTDDNKAVSNSSQGGTDSPPVSAKQYADKGMDLFNRGDYAKAEKELREAIRLEPNNLLWRVRFIDILGMEEKWDEVKSEAIELERLSREALGQDSAKAENHFGLAVGLGFQNKLEEATVEYKEAVRLNTNDAYYRHRLGLVLMLQKQNKEAEAELREAIRLNPGYGSSYGQLSIILYRQKNYSEAESLARKALSINPNNPFSHNALANSLSGQKRYAEAETEYREAIRISPDASTYHRNLAGILKALKRDAEAKQEEQIAADLEKKEKLNQQQK